jgi:transposase
VYDKNLYKRRHKIELIFEGLRAWSRIGMRYDSGATKFRAVVAGKIAQFIRKRAEKTECRGQ